MLPELLFDNLSLINPGIVILESAGAVRDGQKIYIYTDGKKLGLVYSST